MLIYNKTTDKYFWRGAEIPKQEYQKIHKIIHNKPTPPAGYDYHLTDNLEWELVKLPPVEEITDPDEVMCEKAMAYDIMMGGADNA